jgi:hypothetical protein
VIPSDAPITGLFLRRSNHHSRLVSSEFIVHTCALIGIDLASCERSREMSWMRWPSDWFSGLTSSIECPIYRALVIRRPAIGCCASVSFHFVGSLLTGPYAVLQQVIRCVQALQFEACTPCTFGLFRRMSRECVDIEFKLYWQRVQCHLDGLTELVSYTSEEDVQYAVQPYHSIEIIPFLRSDSDRCIFEGKLSIHFLGPGKYARPVSWVNGIAR